MIFVCMDRSFYLERYDPERWRNRSLQLILDQWTAESLGKPMPIELEDRVTAIEECCEFKLALCRPGAHPRTPIVNKGLE